MTEGPERVTIEWPTLDARVTVTFLWDDAPEICRLIAAALPFSTVVEHGVISGAMIYATTRVSTTLRENVQTFDEMVTGLCFFASASQNIGLIYGDVHEPQGQSIWGRLDPADAGVLAGVGRRIWFNTIAPMGDVKLNPYARTIIPMRLQL